LDRTMITPERLAQCDFFARMEPATLEALAPQVSVEERKAGETVFEEGSPGDRLYVIERGRLEVVKGEITGTQRPLAELRAGHVVGEMAVMDLRPRSATVRAISDATLLVITRQALLQLMEENPVAAAEVLVGVAHALSERLRLCSPHLK